MIGEPIILHEYWRSSSAWRVRIALNLKGAAYTRVAHDLLAGEQRAGDYVALAPQGLVPALECGGVVLTQSVAIIEWLEERIPLPSLLPPDAAGKALVRAMAGLIASDIQPLQNLRVLKALKARFGAQQEAIDDWARHWIEQGFAASQSDEHILDYRPVGVKLSDVMADILFTRVAQQIEFGLIGPKNDAVGSDPLKTYGCIFDEVAEFSFAALQGVCA